MLVVRCCTVCIVPSINAFDTSIFIKNLKEIECRLSLGCNWLNISSCQLSLCQGFGSLLAIIGLDITVYIETVSALDFIISQNKTLFQILGFNKFLNKVGVNEQSLRNRFPKSWLLNAVFTVQLSISINTSPEIKAKRTPLHSPRNKETGICFNMQLRVACLQSAFVFLDFVISCKLQVRPQRKYFNLVSKTHSHGPGNEVKDGHICRNSAFACL